MWSSRTSQGPSPQYDTRPRTGVKGLLYSVLGRVHCSCHHPISTRGWQVTQLLCAVQEIIPKAGLYLGRAHLIHEEQVGVFPAPTIQ